MKAGEPLPPLKHQVDPNDLVTMAIILDDPNPIHLDPAAAKAAGLGEKVVNQGPANLAYIINMLTQTFPDHRLESLDSRYLANVFGDDEVEAGGIVTESTDSQFNCEVWLKRADGVLAVTGVATLVSRI